MVEPYPQDDPLLWPLDTSAQGLEEQQLADYERARLRSGLEKRG